MKEKKSKRIKISDCISCWDQPRTDLGWLSQTADTVKGNSNHKEHILKREQWARGYPLPLYLSPQRPDTADQSSIKSTEPSSVPLPMLASSNPCLLQPFQDQLHTQHVKEKADCWTGWAPSTRCRGKDYLYLRLFSEKLWFMTSEACFWKLKTLVGSPQSLSNTGISKWKQNALVCPVGCVSLLPSYFLIQVYTNIF